MENNKDLSKVLESLNRMTGLSLELTVASPEDLSHAKKQLNLLIQAYRETNNKTLIMKKWITGGMDSSELSHTAKRFHIKKDSYRALFFIHSRKDMENTALSILAHAFPDEEKVWIIPMAANSLAMVFTFPKMVSDDKLKETSYLIMDILNTEALMQVKIAFSSVIKNLIHLPEAYQQVNLAARVGEIFYPDQNIYPYNGLGIGRLLHGLSKEQCITYMEETIGSSYESILQPETAYTFRCFFDNNMNIAQTARQLHMHRNTFIYRLEQLQKETGLDVRQFHDAMTFQTALLVMNYLRSDET